MKTIIEHIGDVVSKAFEECGYDASYAKITISNRPDLCEYQCNGADRKSTRLNSSHIL